MAEPVRDAERTTTPEGHRHHGPLNGSPAVPRGHRRQAAAVIANAEVGGRPLLGASSCRQVPSDPTEQIEPSVKLEGLRAGRAPGSPRRRGRLPARDDRPSPAAGAPVTATSRPGAPGRTDAPARELGHQGRDRLARAGSRPLRSGQQPQVPLGDRRQVPHRRRDRGGVLDAVQAQGVRLGRQRPGQPRHLRQLGQQVRLPRMCPDVQARVERAGAQPDQGATHPVSQRLL